MVKMTPVAVVSVYVLAVVTLSEAFPLSPGSFTDYRFYRIFGARPGAESSVQRSAVKRSAPFAQMASVQEQHKRDNEISYLNPADFAIKFGKRATTYPIPEDQYFSGFGKRHLDDYDSSFDTREVIRFG